MQTEIRLYATGEIGRETATPGHAVKPSHFSGTLTKEDAAGLLLDIQQSREEWERYI